MRKIIAVSVLTMSALGLAGPAHAHGIPTAAPAAAPRLDSGPPWPYADCIKAAQHKGETRSYAKWHCDQLVIKGWVKRPKR
ncbi:hypothetical protein [Streptomyces sp. YS-3]|uniref:hypothetical protein n=1 Tax=Streptomyces sp. YS-3 TaxID=3381352 RepID=UPI0038629B2F